MALMALMALMAQDGRPRPGVGARVGHRSTCNATSPNARMRGCRSTCNATSPILGAWGAKKFGVVVSFGGSLGAMDEG
jgi:hypothetical protein